LAINFFFRVAVIMKPMLMVTSFLMGFTVILGALAMIGITRGNRVSQHTWVILWTAISVGFALFLLVSALLYDETLLNYALGGSLGYVATVSIHVLRHAIEEMSGGRRSRVWAYRFLRLWCGSPQKGD
jgi:hypothetical protein